MAYDRDFHCALQAERQVEAQRAALTEVEARRASGVAWSGLTPQPFPARTPDAIARAASARVTALHAWRETRAGRLTTALAAAERAVESVRACLARDLDAEDIRWAVALESLRAAVDASFAAARGG